MSDVKCDGCGSVHRLLEENIGFRDKDSLNCPVCGFEYIDWNGSRIYKYLETVETMGWKLTFIPERSGADGKPIPEAYRADSPDGKKREYAGSLNAIRNLIELAESRA